MKKTMVFACALCLALALALSPSATAGPGELDTYAWRMSSKIRHNLGAEWYQRYYQATAQIELDKRGNVLEALISKPSGNKDFDKAIIVAIRKTGNFGPPPFDGIRMIGIRVSSRA